MCNSQAGERKCVSARAERILIIKVRVTEILDLPTSLAICPYTTEWVPSPSPDTLRIGISSCA